MFNHNIKKLKADGFSFCKHQHVLERGDEVLILRKDGEIIKAKKQEPITDIRDSTPELGSRFDGLNGTGRHDYMIRR